MGNNELSEEKDYFKNRLKDHNIKSLEKVIANAISQMIGDTYVC